MHLLKALGLAKASPESAWSEKLLIGVRNEQGEVYRVIGVTELGEFPGLFGKLRRIGYADVSADAFAKAWASML